MVVRWWERPGTKRRLEVERHEGQGRPAPRGSEGITEHYETQTERGRDVVVSLLKYDKWGRNEDSQARAMMK